MSDLSIMLSTSIFGIFYFKVYRCGKWIKITSTKLLPGDVVSIGIVCMCGLGLVQFMYVCMYVCVCFVQPKFLFSF